MRFLEGILPAQTMLNYVVVMVDDFRAALAEFEERLDKKLDAKLDTRFAALRLDERFAEARAHTEARFDELKTRLDVVHDELKTKLDVVHDELKTRLDVVHDELKTKLDIVYDGVVGVNERVGALELKLDTFEERVERRFDAIAAAARSGGPGRPVRPRRRR
jgi:chromosome segregation ATPase